MSIEKFKRKPSVKSRRPALREDVMRAVLCGAQTEAEIRELTGASDLEVSGALDYLAAQGRITRAKYAIVPGQSIRQAG